MSKISTLTLAVFTLITSYCVIIDAAQKTDHSKDSGTVGELSHLAEKIEKGISNPVYGLHANYNKTDLGMDCLKVIPVQNTSDNFIGVFHNSPENPDKRTVFLAESSTPSSGWKIVNTLEDYASMGYLSTAPDNNHSYFLAYEKENVKEGNRIALRYYDSIGKLKENIYNCEYILNNKVDGEKAHNVGTPSIDRIILISSGNNTKTYKLDLKFHYAPTGDDDTPGYGSFIMKVPVNEELVRKSGVEWNGYFDKAVFNAIKTAADPVGGFSKIGQRDYFSWNGQKYFLYEANIGSKFDWKMWRIFLYSVKEKKACLLKLNIDGLIDIANPHVTLLKNSGKSYKYLLTFFIPGEAMHHGVGAHVKPGEMTADLKLSSNMEADNRYL